MTGSARTLPGWLPDVRLLVAAGALLVFGTVVVVALPTTHRAESAVAVRPDTVDTLSADSLELIAHEYVVLLGSAQAEEAVLGDADDADDAGVAVTPTQDVETATIRIVVEADERERAVEVANALVEFAVDRGEQDDDAKIVVIADATDAGSSSGPPRLLYFGGVLMLAVLLLGAGHYALRGRR